MINRVERLIINLDTTMPIKCNWDDCDRYARTPYRVRLHEHEGTCNSPEAQYGRHTIMSFCSESCRDYWTACTGWSAHDLADRNRGRIYGMHSPGMKRSAV